MQVERIYVKSCCGGTAVVFKLNAPVSRELLQALKDKKYSESEALTKSGILYVDSLTLTVTGAFSSNKLQIKCKKKDACDQALNELEELLKNF